MALTTTLQFWQDQQTLYQKAQASAQSDLTAAQTAQQAANAQLAADLKTLDQVTADIAKKRALLAVTTIPAEANALVADITNDLIKQRGLQGKVLDGRDALDAAQASLAAANATQTRLQAKLADLKAKIAQATAADAQRQALRQAAGSAPLNTLKADAAALNLAVSANALGGLKKNFPQQIIAIAAVRRQQRAQRVAQLQAVRDQAQTALGKALHADGGLQGVAGQALSDFQRAQDTLAQYVAAAASRFDKARAVLQTLEAINADPTPGLTGILTKAEHDQLVADPNAAAGADPFGFTDALFVAAQGKVAQAAADQATAAQKAAALRAAEGDKAQKTLLAGQAAAKAADPAATAGDIAAAQTAAGAAFDAQTAAGQAATDKTQADGNATGSAAAASAAIEAAAAAPKAVSVGISLDAVHQALDDLDAQILLQINADVDQVNSDATLTAKRAAVATALATYKGAVTAFAAGKAGLDQWEAIIPDPAWKVLLDYEEGLAALEELQQTDPAALAQAMDDAENAYTAALADAEKAQRRLDALSDAIGLGDKRLASAQAAISARLPSAIRGDTY